jgi:hypothetical protein
VTYNCNLRSFSNILQFVYVTDETIEEYIRNQNIAENMKSDNFGISQLYTTSSRKSNLPPLGGRFDLNIQNNYGVVKSIISEAVWPVLYISRSSKEIVELSPITFHFIKPALF